ncbi:hypothetical protein [Pseudonocardia alaniniphila]|uniref:Uncharacterized protein n=1 Tax=Pseudonocardia alaniniphila TaxID=75291 RepID=A0ABS9TT66_9PSEU|nr:hypothetical protein [Pseudonocardia alaniniphila]MCH6171691.1 hypothetical protein [Pseudonocardia alaniniphila]
MLIVISGRQRPPEDGAIDIVHAPAIARDPAAPQLGALAFISGPLLRARLPVEQVCPPINVPDEGEADDLHSAPLALVRHPVVLAQPDHIATLLSPPGRGLRDASNTQADLRLVSPMPTTRG